MPSTPHRHPILSLSYGERSEQADIAPVASYLLRLMHVKRTNLCVSADVTTTAELLQLAEQVGDEICVLKTHADIIDDFSEKTIRGLTELAKRKRFIIFEDRKFMDIGTTVQLQYGSGVCSIARWSHIVNASLFAGPSIITSLEETAKKAIAAYNTGVQTDISASPPPDVRDDDPDSLVSPKLDLSAKEADWSLGVEHDRNMDRSSRKQSVVSISTTISTKSESISPQPALRPSRSGSPKEADSNDEKRSQEAELEELGSPPYQRSLLLLAQMSTSDNMLTPHYTAECVKHARVNKKFVIGFIAQESLHSEPDDNFITMTPGVQLSAGSGALNQQYNTPEKVIRAGSDIIIVGRGVYAASDRGKVAGEYRRQGWAAYEERVRAQ